LRQPDCCKHHNIGRKKQLPEKKAIEPHQYVTFMHSIFIADFLVVIHLTFIIFVIVGGFLTLKWRLLVFVHPLAAVWGALIEFSGWICPLTPLEQQFRQAGGTAGYSTTFIEHYLLPIIYPAGLTRELQIFFGFSVVAINAVAYTLLIRRIIQERQNG
jgi:ABC-type polysaccharide/polyol phosphate export permease